MLHQTFMKHNISSSCFLRELDVNLSINRRILLSGKDLPWYLHGKNASMVKAGLATYK